MEILSVADAVKKIRIYLGHDTMRPYFVISDDAADFKKSFDDLKRIYISDFCTDDFFLDVDLLVEKLNMLTNNALIFGLGEYIYLTGQENILHLLQDKNFMQNCWRVSPTKISNFAQIIFAASKAK